MDEQKDKEEQPLSQGEEGKSAEEPISAGDDKRSEVKEADLQVLARALADYKEKHLRLCAEFDNVRKRHEREKNEFVKYANEGLIIDFLGIMDDLERVVAAATVNHQDYKPFLKGVEMVMARVYDLLKKNNVRPMETVGKKFDPHYHEILMQEATTEQEEGTILEEFQKGYYLGDRAVRTAKVKVAVRPEEKEPAAGG